MMNSCWINTNAYRFLWRLNHAFRDSSCAEVLGLLRINKSALLGTHVQVPPPFSDTPFSSSVWGTNRPNSSIPFGCWPLVKCRLWWKLSALTCPWNSCWFFFYLAWWLCPPAAQSSPINNNWPTLMHSRTCTCVSVKARRQTITVSDFFRIF